MSNIIKSGRIRSQSYLDLSQRPMPEVVNVCAYGDVESETSRMNDDDTIELIHKRKEELARLDEEIQEKMKDADKKIEALLAEAIVNRDRIEQEIKEKEAIVMAEANHKQAEIIQLAYEEAEQIKLAAIEEKKTLLESVEGEVVETMISLLKHIISEELNENVDWLKLVVRKMLLQDKSTEAFKLFVSPYNKQLIEKNESRFMDGLSKVTQIECDETINDTTCILETSQGNIEYDVTQGLEKMIAEIRILKDIS